MEFQSDRVFYRGDIGGTFLALAFVERSVNCREFVGNDSRDVTVVKLETCENYKRVLKLRRFFSG